MKKSSEDIAIQYSAEAIGARESCVAGEQKLHAAPPGKPLAPMASAAQDKSAKPAAPAVEDRSVDLFARCPEVYLCIDLKSFYASVECADRGLDPFVTNLVVADPTRTDKTICLAITPAMKDLGIKNRCRVFEIPKSVSYIMATPRMRRYMEVSAQIFRIYLRFVSPCDVHVYSVDECFIYATPYLRKYRLSPKALAEKMMEAVREETHICATAGIGSNLFLAKVALDVTAKHVPDHIGMLNIDTFRREMWHHKPITDIWNIGPGIAKRLEHYGVTDLKGVTDINPRTLFCEFGKNARFLIDHAWGIESAKISDIQSYVPKNNSLSIGQVLSCDYTFDEARIVFHEMTDELCRQLVDRRLVATGVALTVGYGALLGETSYSGGQRKLHGATDQRSVIMKAFTHLFDEFVARDMPIRRIMIGFIAVLPEEFQSVDLFTDEAALAEERALSHTVSAIKRKYGKNSLLSAVSLMDKATARERNGQVGGHRG